MNAKEPNRCYYCFDIITDPEPRLYCSNTCKELDQKSHEEFEELKESGFYSNDVNNLSHI